MTLERSSAARQRIAIIGAGAVGAYYGARLAEAGHDVHFLMRRDYDAVRAHGLAVTSPDGDFTLPRPAVARRADQIGPVDWAICALKATAMDVAPDLLRPCLAAHTRVLVLMNGLGLEERFGEWFGVERIFGGMAFTCINRGAPGQVTHLRYGAVTLGHLSDDPIALEEALRLWQGAKVEVSGTDCLPRTRWEKLAWNIPFNGLCVSAGGVPTDRIVGDPALRAAALATMEEVVRAGNADLATRGAPAQIDAPALTARLFALTDAMGSYRPSTVIDFIEGRPMEVKAMFGEPLRRAEALGVETPRMQILAALLRSLDERSGGAASSGPA